MDTSSITRRALGAMARNGHAVMIGGVSVPCYPTAMRDNELRNREQTFREEYSATVAVIAADAEAVEIGAVVTFDGRERRVLDFSATPDGLQVLLHLGRRYGSRA